MTEMDKRRYNKILDEVENGGTTPPLGVFVDCLDYDDNFIWRIGTGHLSNAFEEAIDLLRKHGIPLEQPTPTSTTLSNEGENE